MNRIILERAVDADGRLRLDLPLGADEAGQNVRLTIESVEAAREMTVEDWQAGVLSTAGGWHGDFERPAPGLIEEREPLS